MRARRRDTSRSQTPYKRPLIPATPLPGWSLEARQSAVPPAAAQREKTKSEGPVVCARWYYKLLKKPGGL